jgi:phospholipid-binding lipoprotein MlaA
MLRQAPVIAVTVLLLTSCIKRGPNPLDPYECFNRKVHAFNMALDVILIRPPARLYFAVVPPFVRKSIDNAFNNLDMVPTVANDILQGQVNWAVRDSWRFAVNSTLGIGGLIDVAQKFSLPPHYNDLGLTFAHWGDKNSPYLVLPIIGPSTIRDGVGWAYQFVLWSPYVYLHNTGLAFGLAGLRIIDLRTQMFDAERFLVQAIDKYAFIRDAYLQRRQYLINGGAAAVGNNRQDTEPTLGSDYVEE